MQPKMSDVVMRDYAIKLFGKTISLSPDEHSFARSVAVSDQNHSFTSETSASTNIKDISMEEITRTKHEEDDRESTDPTEQTQIEEHEEEAATSSGTRTTTDSHLKTMKRPEKILPCPRCESADTKFCYYNNHNMNQPRHFCKNCQRFWTEGGSMRKIPIGSGRRKNKKASVPEVMSMMVDFNFKSELNESNYPYSGFPVTFCPVNSNRDRAIYSKGSSLNVPKSLKIHDPSEAAKSSIWCTLGYEKSNGKTRNVFKAFESTTHERICRNMDCSSLVLQANPAALSRSLNFHENA